MEELTQPDVTRALAGDEVALTRLVDSLTPVIQARVARQLLRNRGTAGKSRIRQEVEDFTQEVFLLLFADGAKVLRGWQPERGLSLKNFVGLISERRTLSILRRGRNCPWKEDPTFTEAPDVPADDPPPDRLLASRQVLERLLLRLREELSPLGSHLFDLLFVREHSVAEVRRRTGLSRDAVYAWRSRLRRLVRRLIPELTSENAGHREYPSDRRLHE